VQPAPVEAAAPVDPPSNAASVEAPPAGAPAVEAAPVEAAEVPELRSADVVPIPPRPVSETGSYFAVNPRVAEAVALSAVALQHFVNDDHHKAREAVEKALQLDPENRRALELQKILRVLG
jgi:hypothetical protein